MKEDKRARGDFAHFCVKKVEVLISLVGVLANERRSFEGKVRMMDCLIKSKQTRDVSNYN